MTQLEIKLQELKDATIETMYLVRGQMSKAKDAFVNVDSSLASEVIHYENRVNATELSIDKDCEKVLALYHPVAADLRFVIATLRMNGHLERIGDHSYGIAKTVLQMDKPYDDELLERLRFKEMFDTAISMIDDAIHAFNFEDTQLARWIFGKDSTLNEINKVAWDLLALECAKQPENAKMLMLLFSTMRKVERMGDLAKNVAEETIYFIESKVLKHNSPNE